MLAPDSASVYAVWNQLPTPLGVDKAMQRPPVEIVGYNPVHRSLKPSIKAASSITRRDRASDRPASPEVDEALI